MYIIFIIITIIIITIIIKKINKNTLIYNEINVKEENKELSKIALKNFDESNNIMSKKRQESILIDDNNQKIKNFISAMSLSELTSIMPLEAFARIPHTRKAIEEEVFNEIKNGKINFKVNNSVYYIDSDNALENNKDYYNDNFKERTDDLLYLEPIQKTNDQIIKNIDLFNNLCYNDIEQILAEDNDDSFTFPERTLEERIIDILSYDISKKNIVYFEMLLNEYNNLDQLEKSKINRKYTSELERMLNKAKLL